MSSKHVGAVADRVAIWIMHSVYSNLFKEFVLSLKRRSFRAAKSLLIQWRKVKWMRMLIKMHCLPLSRSLADWWSRNTVFGPERFELKFDPNNKKVKVIWSINLAILQQYCMCGGKGGGEKKPLIWQQECVLAVRGMHGQLFLLDDFQRFCQLMGVWHSFHWQQERKNTTNHSGRETAGLSCNKVVSFTMYYVLLLPSLTARLLETYSQCFS